MAEQEILIVDKSLVHCCAIMKKVIVESQLYDTMLPMCQFTVPYIGVWVASLIFLGSYVRHLVPNNTCWPQNFVLTLWLFFDPFPG